MAPLIDLSVSVYLPDEIPEGFQLTGHDPSHQTVYLSLLGNFADTTDMPVHDEVEAFLFVTGVEVLAPQEVGGIVAFGDSLTEGNISEFDANNRWPDQLARRLATRQDGRQFCVVNQGTGGGRCCTTAMVTMRCAASTATSSPSPVSATSWSCLAPTTCATARATRRRWSRRTAHRRLASARHAGPRGGARRVRRHGVAVGERDLPRRLLHAGRRGRAAGSSTTGSAAEPTSTE